MLSMLVFDASSIVASRIADARTVTAASSAEWVGQFSKTTEATTRRVFLERQDTGDDQGDFAHE